MMTKDNSNVFTWNFDFFPWACFGITNAHHDCQSLDYFSLWCWQLQLNWQRSFDSEKESLPSKSTSARGEHNELWTGVISHWILHKKKKKNIRRHFVDFHQVTCLTTQPVRQLSGQGKLCETPNLHNC